MTLASARRLFGALLRAFPSGFRREFGDEMESVFAEALAEAAGHGRWAVLRCLAREAAHLPGLAAHAHWQAWAQPAAGAGTLERQVAMTTPSKIIVYGLLPLLLAALGWLISPFMVGDGIYRIEGLACAVAGALLAPALAWAVRHLSPWVWVVAGLALLAALLMPGIARVDPGEYLAPAAGSPLPGFAWWMPPVALLTAAMLLQIWLRPSGGPNAGSRLALLCAVLGGLLLARTLHYLYWLLVWDLTTDSLNFIWIFLPMLAALVAGAVLWATLLGRPWAALTCAVLIPALVAGVFILSQQVDYRALTARRAARAAQAIEAYYARTGTYPATLRQAQPWYALPLAGPVIIYGQGWCYHAGADFYRLGYVDREHWYVPYLTAHLASAAGDAAGAPPLCDAEIAALVERFPIYSRQDP